jgi:hypothetical protein
MERSAPPTRPAHAADLRNAAAPEPPNALAVCPHCWMVNVRAPRLCGRCGADMSLVLQESGGLRATAPVQSPVPVRGVRLSTVQRAIVLCFVALLVIAQIISAIYASARRSSSGAVTPAVDLLPDVPESS